MSNATNLSFTCVNDLLQEAKINFRGRKPPNVYRTLPALREKSDLAKKQGDDETAYIMLKKWLNSVEWLRTRVKDGKVVNFYAPNMTVDQINEVKNILADMEQKLEVRYELKQNNIVEKMEVETDVATDEDEMDVPNSEIGLKLPEIPTEEKINIENEILETFECPDLLVVYSNVKEDRIRKNKLNNKNIDVEMDQHGGNKSAISRHIKSNSNDTVSPNKSQNFVTQVTISIDDKRPSRGDSVNGQQLDSPDSPVLSRPKMRSNKVLQNVSVKPMIDRSSKPITLKTCDPRCKEVLRFMKELNELAKSKEKLANELFCQEYQLYSQREDKYSASDENYLRADIKSLIVKLEDMHKMYLKIENEYKTYLNEAGTINYNATEDNEKKNLELALFFSKE